MAKRIQSPSSINLYKQCPRRYFYQYILKLPSKPSIYLIRGKIVHKVLERFFELDVSSLDLKDYKFGFHSYIKAHLLKLWKSNSKGLSQLGLTNEQLEYYLKESKDMLDNFVDIFSEKLFKRIEETQSLEKAFKMMTPFIEERIVNEELGVQGFIDAIHDEGQDIIIMDYKTSNKNEITQEYKLQLGIYALLYKLKYKQTPKQVGINFLKYGEQIIDVDQELLDEAQHEIKYVHEMTVTDNIDDYPIKESGLCKWSNGQCDFYDECIKNR